MGYHPVNLAVRFVLELAAFAAFVIWGHELVPRLWGWVIGVGVGIAAVTVWTTFAVPGDRTRSGQAPVPVPGWLRLLIELGILGGAVLALDAAGRPGWALWFGIAIAVHYALSWDHINWLVRQR